MRHYLWQGSARLADDYWVAITASCAPTGAASFPPTAMSEDARRRARGPRCRSCRSTPPAAARPPPTGSPSCLQPAVTFPRERSLPSAAWLQDIHPGLGSRLEQDRPSADHGQSQKELLYRFVLPRGLGFLDHGELRAHRDRRSRRRRCRAGCRRRARGPRCRSCRSTPPAAARPPPTGSPSAFSQRVTVPSSQRSLPSAA